MRTGYVMRKGLGLGVIVVTAAMAAVLPASPASAATLSCGDTISTSVALTHNLSCAGSGLVVGADGITIDLRGHKLSGSGAGIGIDGAGSAPQGVTVKNGTIRGFDTAISDLSSGSKLAGMKVVANNVGADWIYATITGSTFRDNTVAVWRGGVTVTGSTFLSNGTGILGTSLGNTNSVASSTFRENGEAIRCYDNGTIVTDSVFVDNTQSIRSILNCSLFVHDSVFNGGEIAVQLAQQIGFTLDVQGNRFSGAKIGMSIEGLFGGAGYVIADNVFKRNGASGLLLNVEDISPDNSVQITGNTFKNNGFWHDPYLDPTGKVLNAGVWANTGTFTDNRAVKNGGYGIEGYGVIDGGGNTARGNGNPDQCLGVTCTR
jgi:hypothetical protein